MNQPETCKISYLGFSKTSTPSELEFEILGLKHLISKASQRIAELEQSLKLSEFLIKKIEEESSK